MDEVDTAKMRQTFAPWVNMVRPLGRRLDGVGGGPMFDGGPNGEIDSAALFLVTQHPKTVATVHAMAGAVGSEDRPMGATADLNEDVEDDNVGTAGWGHRG